MGDFALFVYYLGFVSDFTQFFGMFLAHYRQTAVAFARMAVLLQGAPPRTLVAPHPLPLRGPLPVSSAPPPPAPAAPARLEVRGLTYVYPESGRGIRDVALTVGAGELVVVTGRIGAGKTTLLRALLGLLPAQGGTICWNGDPVLDPAAFFQPPHSAYTSQVPQLFSATLEENVRLGLDVPADRLAAALDAAVLGADLAALPAGLATPVGARGVRLSGGQVQRVAAARMLVRAPALLVFDDLSSALDVTTERQLWDHLLALPDRPACLVVAHRPAVLRRADRLIVLDEGRVVAAGPPAAVLAAHPALLHGDSAANGAA